MDRQDTLATLLAQAIEEGADATTLRAIVEEACELGAKRALGHIGLSDHRATRDISDLRHLLTSWRDVQTTARRTAVRWLTTALLTVMVIGLAVYSKLPAALGLRP